MARLSPIRIASCRKWVARFAQTWQTGGRRCGQHVTGTLRRGCLLTTEISHLATFHDAKFDQPLPRLRTTTLHQNSKIKEWLYGYQTRRPGQARCAEHAGDRLFSDRRRSAEIAASQGAKNYDANMARLSPIRIASFHRVVHTFAETWQAGNWRCGEHAPSIARRRRALTAEISHPPTFHDAKFDQPLPRLRTTTLHQNSKIKERSYGRPTWPASQSRCGEDATDLCFSLRPPRSALESRQEVKIRDANMARLSLFRIAS